MTRLHMQAIRKTFGSVIALNNVSLTVAPNEIHGLLGGNGAGKTTLMNVLYGLYKPDGGDISLNGQPLTIHAPRDALQHGIGMVHQHFLQVDRFSVLDNIVLGMGRVNRRQARQQINELAQRFGLTVDLSARVERLPLGVRQRVEILKALYRGVEVLILDEPTTNLTPQEVDTLFVSLREMVQAGLSIIFITHKLREVLTVCDRITVLRDGETVLTVTQADASQQTLVEAMVGQQLNVADSVVVDVTLTPNPSVAPVESDFDTLSQRDSSVEPVETEPVETEPVEIDFDNSRSQPTVQVKNLRVLGAGRRAVLSDCEFTINRHEILGIAGVADNGQQPLAEALLGLRKPTAGQLIIDGLDVTSMPTAQRLQAGQIAYIPEDRMHDGVLPGATVAQNLILGFQRQQPYSGGLFLRWRQIYQAAQQMIGEYNIRTLGPQDVGANLSGGNIQRLLIARAFSFPAKLLIAHNPTQGLDIASMEFVYSKLLARRSEGGATLLMSENLDELIRLCDRIAVMYQGQISGILSRPQFDSYEIGRLMGGGEALS